MTGERYLDLREGCTLVRGAKGGAIYDLRDGELYRLDERMTLALRLAGAGLPVSGILERMEGRGHPRGVLAEALAFLEGLPVVEARPSPGTGSDPVPTVRPRHTLEFMWLELTSVCNLQCVHCYAEAGSAPRPDEMGREEWMEILEEAAALGCRQVQFTGGDPTIHPDLLPLIRRARELGYTFIEIFTNALLLTEEKIRFLKENDVAAAVSFYSHDPAIHDQVTGKAGSWKRTSDSIRALLEEGVPVRVAVIVMRPNEEGLEETLRFVRSLGVKNVKVDTIRPTGRGTDPDLFPRTWASEMTRPDFKIRCCDDGLSFNSCWSGKIAVESRGRVVPCIFSRDKVAGDLRRQSLREVVTGTKMQFFWDFTLDRVEICRDCEFRFACRDCRAIAHTTHGSIAKKSPRCTYDPYTGRWGEGSARQVHDLYRGLSGSCPDEVSTMRNESSPPGKPLRPGRRRDVLSREVDGEFVLFDPVTNGIHGLNPTASFIWDLCDGSRTPGEIAAELGAIYPEQDGIQRDVEQTLDQLRSLGLLEG